MMRSLILQTATRFLITLLLLFSLFLLVRGHHLPGGGFAGGLVAAGAFGLHSLAFDERETRRLLRVDPVILTAAGLVVALVSGLPGLLSGQPYLTARWGYLPLPGALRVELGTPLLFDLGVYFAVLGTTLTIILALEEEG